MEKEQKYDIFISYRKDDTREKVELIYSSLEDFYSDYKYPKKLKIFYDIEALSQRWSEKILTHIDSDTCDKFIIVIGDKTFNFTDEDRSPKMVNFYEDLAKSSKIEALAKIKKYKKENPNKRVDYMRLEIARALQKSNVNIVPLCLYRETPIEIQDLKLPGDISDLENYQGVSYHNHRSNTSPISTIFPDIDRHLFSEKFKPYNSLFRYILSILSKYWQWTVNIFALIVVLLIWVQKHPNMFPNFKRTPSSEQVISIKKHKVAKESQEYVDLGLSVKWATCNVGASSPIEKGYAFSWGEIIEGKYHNWESYKYSREKSSYITKYCDNETQGIVDRRMTLELSDDAANYYLGSKWRIPTKNELQELMSKCIWQKEKNNNVEGYRVIGNNGNSIFIPITGHLETVKQSSGNDTINTLVKVRITTRICNLQNGYYWTNALDVNDSKNAWGMFIDADLKVLTTFPRYKGLYIRPVYNNQ